MNAEALREQIRAQVRLATQRLAPTLPTPALGVPGAAVVVPLHLGSAAHTGLLTELFQRLAANPALLRMVDAGLLRFDLRVDAAALQGVAGAAGTAHTSAKSATTPTDPAACCASCKAGKACECQGDPCDLQEHKTAESVPELSGVLGEKLIKTLPPNVTSVRLHPKAVLTPLGKEALRKRGIAIDRGARP